MDTYISSDRTEAPLYRKSPFSWVALTCMKRLEGPTAIVRTGRPMSTLLRIVMATWAKDSASLARGSSWTTNWRVVMSCPRCKWRMVIASGRTLVMEDGFVWTFSKKNIVFLVFLLSTSGAPFWLWTSQLRTAGSSGPASKSEAAVQHRIRGYLLSCYISM